MPVVSMPAGQSLLSAPPVDGQGLMERYLPLVRGVVGHIKLNLPNHIDADDLFSVGVVGLIAAVKKYDPRQGSTFSSYASVRIRGAILDELRRMDWAPRRARTRAKNLKKATDEVEQKLGRPATDDEVRASLGLSAEEYQKWLDEAKPIAFIAIDQIVEGDEDGGSSSIHELLADESDRTGRDHIEKAELRELLTERIAELPDIPKKILAMYYFEEMRFKEIAKVFDLTESRICQIHAQTVLGLRAWLLRVRNR